MDVHAHVNACVYIYSVGKSMGDKLQPVTAEERENPLTGRSQSVPGASNNNSSIEQSQATTNIVRTDKSESLSAQPREPERDSGKSLLQQSLDKIMAGLEARRKSSGRPTDPLVRILYLTLKCFCHMEPHMHEALLQYCKNIYLLY